MIAPEKRGSSFGNSNGSKLLDASFSSYLNGSGTEEGFMLKLSHPPQINTFNQKKKAEDGEIGIFGAEKYFKGAIDEELPRTPSNSRAVAPYSRPRNSHEKEHPFPPPKPRTQSATPSVRSESSWNSRSGLLASARRQRIHQSRGERNSSVKSLLSTLGCNCNDKGSVKVKENRVHVKEIAKQPVRAGDLAQRTKSLSNRLAEEDVHGKKFDFTEISLKKEDCFTFPVLNSSKATANHPAVKTEPLEPELGEGEAEITHISTRRNSSEVFGSPILEKGKKSFSLERKLTMLNWDVVTPRLENMDISKNGNNNDTGSDASSDLFEIESFSTNGNNAFLARQASDGNNGGRASNATLPNGYAPSEASIDWSVVTASVADFSLVSDYEEMKTSKPFKAVGEMERAKGAGILSGCKSLKAVRVAGDEHWMNGGEKGAAMAAGIGPTPRERCRLDAVTPIARFQAEAKLMSTGLDAHRSQNGSSSIRSIPRAYSTQATHLYIQ